MNFNVSISNGKIKCPIGKSFFAVNLALKLFHATVANTDTESPKSLHTFICYVFGPHAVEIWSKYGLKCTKFWIFWQKTKFFLKHFWWSVDAILQEVSVVETIV